MLHQNVIDSWIVRYPIQGKEAYSFKQELTDKKPFESCSKGNSSMCTLENGKEITIASGRGNRIF